MSDALDPLRRALPRLLRGQARTMELSLRLLPRSLREPLGLAYLLARITDTVADAGTLPREERIAWLEGVERNFGTGMIAAPRLPEPGEFSQGEVELLGFLPGLLQLLATSPDREELIQLWREILEAQLFDLRRFTPEAPPLERGELERYCDTVAGSVGRSWTRLIAARSPESLLVPVEELLLAATAYGKGLQLVNILRDREADQLLGRQYVTEERMPELLALAGEWLLAAESYLEGLRPGRILAASALPLDLARATLPLIAHAPSGVLAKLTRGRVRLILAAAVPSLWLPRRRDPVS